MPTTTYSALREHIEAIIAEGKTLSRHAGDWERVATYWHIGDALQTHISAQPSADYGLQIVPNLSKDIRLSQSLLWDILLFRRSLTKLPARRELTWTHIREVLRAPTQDQRRYYLQLADAGSWSTRQLREAISADLYGETMARLLAVPLGEDPFEGRPMRARFGELFTYRLHPDARPGSHDLHIDLGFRMTTRVPLTGIGDPHAGMIVASEKRADGTYTFTPRPPRTRLYTCVAWPQRVIDGDTLIAVADPGLHHQTRELRLRLRGIDTPELTSLAGQHARDFVTEALSAVSFVVITTFRTDLHGRFLADLRYLPGESDPQVVRRQGIYLNRQLLDEHLARRYPS